MIYSKQEQCWDEFFEAIDRLVESSSVIIDRPKGTTHPRYPSLIYPVDYGYLADTSSMDDNGIDVYKGTNGNDIDSIVCTVDLLKRDSEIKILIGCTEQEKELIMKIHNDSEFMKGILIRRKYNV